MKKHILLISACFIMFSCSKDHTQGGDPVSKTYRITYKINAGKALENSAITTLNMNSLRINSVATDTSYLKMLYYLVFDSNNNLVRYLKQDSTSLNFGVITDSLASGTYTVNVAAGQSGFDNNINGQFLESYYFFYKGGAWKDTFYDKFKMIVSNNAVDQDVTLRRIVGQLQINFTDQIPANAKYITVTIKNENLRYVFFDVGSNSPESSPLTFKTSIPQSAVGHNGFKIIKMLNNTSTPFEVTITCYNSSNIIISNILVSNVTCQKNKKTILSGKLLGNSNAFSITVNSDWDTTPITVHF